MNIIPSVTKVVDVRGVDQSTESLEAVGLGVHLPIPQKL